MCCKGGKVTISQVPAPDELLQLFLDSSTEGRHFRQHIRSYNHVMSFTSLGVHVDESLIAIGRGIYTSRAQGVIYHKIGGFHPNQGSRPRYLQLYIYDTDHELQNRMRENPILNQVVVLLIKECSSNQPQYSLPSAFQVATIVIGSGDEDTIERGRDINVINCDGKLTKVQETMGFYDPLHKRDMIQRYQDGMAIVLNNGKPDIFLTMTCNPSWIEITSEVGLHQTPQDRPDVLTRIFRSKFDQLKDDVINKGVLGRVKSYMYVTEFQKHGLPHVYRLLILDTDDKLREPEEYDSVVKAEIPRHEYFFCHTLTDSLSEVNHNFQ
ncbi:hypothetical protein KIW84_035131 [Lathyrus oleraceus]|uniref:Helitron helicase-like domain-containing protein n=1 Tax=Pisum sativum TaxID=3888 RepID=A0A9D4Y1A1_PEA|nr:hypothetical protein KIW84_035131 [Pisum sativum]